jgi:hypothetical protein
MPLNLWLMISGVNPLVYAVIRFTLTLPDSLSIAIIGFVSNYLKLFNPVGSTRIVSLSLSIRIANKNWSAFKQRFKKSGIDACRSQLTIG